MAVSTNPADLAEAAACFCYDVGTAQKVKLYLLREIAGLSDKTPEELAEDARCFCMNIKDSRKVEAYLLCTIANLQGE